MKKIYRIFYSCTAFSIMFLCGCAGQHVLPPADYAQVKAAKTVRVAFDQDGSIYPRTISDTFDWTKWKPSWIQKNKGGPFSISNYLAINGKANEIESINNKARQDAVNALNSTLKDGDTLIILIRGFNVPFNEAAEGFGYMNELIQRSRDDSAVLEVYWDGLVTQSDSAKDSPAIMAFWPNALTYSNLAGQCGLRPLLNEINHDVHLRFVTHSRGAAVALSSLINPEYDNGINRCEGEATLNNPRIKSIKIAAFAPAIGNGHLHDKFDATLLPQPINMAVGVNSKDVATAKSVVSADFWGDTRLGSDYLYLYHELSKNRKNLRLVAIPFEHGSTHHIDAYLHANPILSRCLLHQVDLLDADSVRCEEFILR